MNPTLIAIIVSGALGVLGGYSFQATRIDKLKKDYAHERTAQELATLKTLERNQGAVIAAQDSASRRVVALRRDADSARRESDSLRDSIATAMRAANASHDACLIRTHACGVVLDQCATAYQGLGERCDRHVSDIKLITESWPN